MMNQAEISLKLDIRDGKLDKAAVPDFFFYQPAGKGFSELLLEVRMRKAKLLLNNTDLSIEKIVTMLGYSNSSNFYKFFKSYYGHTPRKK